MNHELPSFRKAFIQISQQFFGPRTKRGAQIQKQRITLEFQDLPQKCVHRSKSLIGSNLKLVFLHNWSCTDGNKMDLDFFNTYFGHLETGLKIFDGFQRSSSRLPQHCLPASHSSTIPYLESSLDRLMTCSFPLSFLGRTTWTPVWDAERSIKW